MESLLGRNLTQAGVARLRLDRAAAAFPEISELGYLRTLGRGIGRDERRRLAGS